VDRQVEVHTGPGPESYHERRIHAPGDTIPVIIGGQEVGQVAVAEIFPRI
jgi:hypothetical protein